MCHLGNVLDFWNGEAVKTLDGCVVWAEVLCGLKDSLSRCWLNEIFATCLNNFGICVKSETSVFVFYKVVEAFGKNILFKVFVLGDYIWVICGAEKKRATLDWVLIKSDSAQFSDIISGLYKDRDGPNSAERLKDGCLVQSCPVKLPKLIKFSKVLIILSSAEKLEM